MKKICSIFLCLILCMGSGTAVYAQEEFTADDFELYQDSEEKNAAEEFQDESSGT